MNIEELRIKNYMKLSAKRKLRFLLEYKLFVKKATSSNDKKLLIMLKKKDNSYRDEFPPSIMNSE